MKFKMNWMIKLGYLLLLSCFVILSIIWFTSFMDINGKIGASVIVCGVCGGNCIALMVRGRMEWYLKHKDDTQ